MLSTLIVTHGGLAGELLSAAQTISGEIDRFEALSLDWQDGVDEVRGKIESALARLDAGEGVLILVDTYGGTPHNVALSLTRKGEVEVVSGVNLPMVMRLACLGNRQQTDPTEAAQWLQAKGREAIRVGCEPAANGKAGNGQKAAETGECGDVD